MLMMP
jgi:centrin-3